MTMSHTAPAESLQSVIETGASESCPSVGTRQDLVHRAEALVPVLRARAAEADALRQLPAHTARDLKASGIARILQPAWYGGFEASFAGMFDILRTIGRRAGSTAWGLAHYIAHNFLVSPWAPPTQ